MTGFDCRLARRRRTTMQALLLTAALGTATSAFAQQPPAAPAQPPATEGQQPAQPAAPAAAQPNPFMFSSDAAMLTFFIKPDKAADFEKVMEKLHQALANSDKPERKQQAAGWKLYKAAEPGPNGTVLYINFLSPALKGGDYTISKILAEVYPQEVQQLFPLYRDAFAGLSRAELKLVQDFSTPAPPSTPAPAPPAQ
jgi:hypothetical protein